MLSPQYDFYSDTLTKPTPDMRKFMCDAEVGDEQRFEDPTVNQLQDMVAEMTNKEGGLYLPSGTMCNEIAFLVNCLQGDEIIMDISAHPYNAELGAPAVLGGITVRPIAGNRGVFTAEQVEEAIRPATRYPTRTRLVSIEQTANLTGGVIWPITRIHEVFDVVKKHNLFMHMDGARVFNAVVATGIPIHKYVEYFDTVWIDFSKGLGAPVGAVLAGNKEFIKEAWRWKQRLGGAMRQAGIIAAACIYALKHNINRLAEDHENAKYLAEKLCELPGIAVNPKDVETNIVIFDIAGTGKTALQFADELSPHSVRFTVIGKTRMRGVTYLGITKKHIEAAIEIVGKILKK